MSHILKSQSDILASENEIANSDPIASGLFGAAVHDDKLDQRIIVGSFLHSSPGEAIIYRSSASGLTEEYRFNVTDLGINEAGDAHFGRDVAIFGDVAVIGGPKSESTSPTGPANSGAAWVLKRINGVWTPEQRLQSESPIASGEFGRSVCCYQDDALGDVVGIGMSNNGSGTSAMDIYRRNGGTWTKELQVTSAADGYSGAFNGYMDAELRTLVSKGTSNRLIVLDYNGSSWDISHISGPADTVTFGSRTAIHGNLIATSDRKGAGRLILYRKSQSGVWNQEAILGDESLANGSLFGWVLGCRTTSKGDYAFASANGSPVVSMYEATAGSWNRTARFLPSRDVSGEAFGDSGSMNNRFVVIGCPLSDPAAINNAGTIFTYGPVLRQRSASSSSPVTGVQCQIGGIAALSDGSVGEFRASFDTKAQAFEPDGQTIGSIVLSDPSVLSQVGKFITIVGFTSNSPSSLNGATLNDATLSFSVTLSHNDGSQSTSTIVYGKNIAYLTGDGASVWNDVAQNPRIANVVNKTLRNATGESLSVVGS